MSFTAAPLTGTSPESELFDRALIDLDVDKKARDAGVKDQPPPNSVGPDANERQFIAYFSDKLRDRRKRCEGTLSKFALHRSATSSKIDISQTRSSLVSTFVAFSALFSAGAWATGPSCRPAPFAYRALRVSGRLGHSGMGSVVNRLCRGQRLRAAWRNPNSDGLVADKHRPRRFYRSNSSLRKPQKP